MKIENIVLGWTFFILLAGIGYGIYWIISHITANIMLLFVIGIPIVMAVLTFIKISDMIGERISNSLSSKF